MILGELHIARYKSCCAGVTLVYIITYIECVALIGNIEGQHIIYSLTIRGLQRLTSHAEAIIVHMVVISSGVQVMVGKYLLIRETHVAFPY